MISHALASAKLRCAMTNFVRTLAWRDRPTGRSGSRWKERPCRLGD